MSKIDIDVVVNKAISNLSEEMDEDTLGLSRRIAYIVSAILKEYEEERSNID